MIKMPERNKIAELQAIAWIIYNQTFRYIKDGYLSGNELLIYTALKTQFEATGKFDETILVENLQETIQQAYNAACPHNFEVILHELDNSFKRIKSAYATSKAAQALAEKPEETNKIILGTIEYLSKLLENTSQSEYNHSKSLEKCIAYINEGVTSKGALKGIKSGISRLDEMIRGWQHNKMYVIGGLKKTGKSRFALNLVSSWLSQGYSGLIYSMEMSENDIHTCVLANRAQVNSGKFGTNDITSAEISRIENEIETYKKQSLCIDKKSAISTIDVLTGIKRIKSKGKLDFVIVDYIQRMEGIGDKRARQIEQCATGLANISRDEGVIMVLLSQLSGAAEHKNDSPIYSFFKESQAIIEACDCALVLADEHRGEEKSKDGYELSCTILQRDGISDVKIPIFAEHKYSRFSDLDRTMQPEKDVKYDRTRQSEDW